jgi:alpha-tubulin suppressor-like RCC1 family protein
MAVLQYLMMGTKSVSRQIITGDLYMMGNNNSGCLGTGDTTHAWTEPVQTGAESDWQNTILNANSYGGNLAVKSDGTLWAWGDNSAGALGDGSTTNRSSPVQIGSLTDWSEVATIGTSSSAAIKTDGTLWTWGENSHGQLGDGSQTDRSSPAQVGSLTDWAHIIPMYVRATYALKTDGTLWMWGNVNGSNSVGTNISSPAQCGSDSDWTDAWGHGLGTYHFRMWLMKG